jgi:hypothetical protein
LDPSGKFIYAASFPTDDPKVGIIDGFQIDNGHLIPLPGTPFVSPVQAADGQNPVFQNLAIARDGKVLYASDPNEGNGIAIFGRDTKTGALTFREAFNSGTPFGAIAITPSGKFLLAPGGNVMFQYEIGPHDNLTPVAGSPFAVPGGAGFAAASPDGEFVATTGLGVSMLRETHRDQLTLVPGSPFGGDSATGTDITFDPLGRFVLLPGLAFRVHPETGALTQVSDFAGGNAITALRPCKLHDERDRDKHDGDNKDFDGKKDDNDKNALDCNDGEENRGRD